MGLSAEEFPRPRSSRHGLRRGLARWLNSRPGLGAVVFGMNAQGFSVELKEFPDGWRANFYPVDIAHSVVTGSAWEPTPWIAPQRAAWEALMKARRSRPDDR